MRFPKIDGNSLKIVIDKLAKAIVKAKSCKIKYVDYPIESHHDCEGCMDSLTNTMLIKKTLTKHKKRIVIIHEYGHYLLGKVRATNINKHWINCLYDVLWTFLFDSFKNKRKNILWYIKYYCQARKNNEYVI